MGYIFRLFALVGVTFIVSCSFDYETITDEDNSIPDIVLESMEWVRVRGGDPTAKLIAEKGERYEKSHIMELSNYSFEQYNTSSGAVDSVGEGGKARIELESGNIKMNENVIINVDSDDIKLDAEDLEWRDKERALSSGQYTMVHIMQDDGTDFSGAGFSADVRSRTWLFTAGAGGDFYLEDDEESAPAAEQSPPPAAAEPGAPSAVTAAPSPKPAASATAAAASPKPAASDTAAAASGTAAADPANAAGAPSPKPAASATAAAASPKPAASGSAAAASGSAAAASGTTAAASPVPAASDTAAAAPANAAGADAGVTEAPAPKKKAAGQRAASWRMGSGGW
ncbi:MAG: LPS export ABC transporter periplasmic protein LptC [Spirochaetaceae bacterium]|jgi:LPS export ABC transporter protein LptC|nr:LPS export ABC transporter periplasmic protein LptC [Spirochaetaceae bacterium]